MPLFSVVVPAFNAESTLRETLVSIIDQTFSDWELLVVNDGSTDRTLEIAEEYAASDERIRVIDQENKGPAQAYNAGFAASSGELLTICAADDMLLPEHLSLIAELVAAHPECDIFSSNGYRQYEDGSREVRYPAGHWKAEGPWTLERVITTCFFSVGATFRRRLLDTVGGFRDVYGDDYDFWLRAMARGARHCCTPVPSAVHRRTATQKSANLEQMATSDLFILTDLRDSGLLSESEIAAADAAIELRHQRLRSLGLTREDRVANAADRQAGRVKDALAGLIGKRRTKKVLSAARKMSWLIRPVRLALANVAVLLKGSRPKR